MKIKDKMTAILVLGLVLTLTIPATFSDNTFSVDYTFEPVKTKDQWMIRDTSIREIPGEPLIPCRTGRILLPYGVELKDVKVKHGETTVQKEFELPWGQPPCTAGSPAATVARNEEIYSTDEAYPSNLIEVLGVEYCKGFAILNIVLFPIQYQPESRTVRFYSTLTVEIKTGKGSTQGLYRGLPADKKEVAGLVDNPEVLFTYADAPVPLATEEYIIITNDAMQSTFQTLATHKAAYVNGATVYTTTWIYANYTGRDNAEKIRNFIKDKYTNNGTDYVLLGGDIAAVPYRGFYVSTAGYTDTDMLADMYFSHLDGTFNDDNDIYWAETSDGVDWYAEVAVGRAPCETVTEAQNFVNKVINFEFADKPKRVLLHQSRLQAGNIPDSRCLAYSCNNYIPTDYTIDYLFEENGTVTKSVWVSHWAQNPLIVVHFGHGNTNVHYINYENGGTVSWYNSDIPSLTNTFCPVLISTADCAGEIEANDCLGEAYVMGCKAFAFIGNDNYGWHSTTNACQYSGEFVEMMFRAFYSDGKQKLGEMLNQARSYLVSSAQSNSTYRWCFYEINLVGDPESPCLTKRGVGGDTVTLECRETWSMEVEIVAHTTGCIDTVEFYIDGTLEHTDTVPPFGFLWDTTQYPDGSHTIEAKGYCSGVFKDSDTCTYTINNHHVTITNPTNGSTVSGTVTVTVDAATQVTKVEFYVDGPLTSTDTASPFSWSWDTTAYSDASHTVMVKGYDSSNALVDDDLVAVTVDNTSSCLGTTVIFLLELFGVVSFYRRH